MRTEGLLWLLLVSPLAAAGAENRSGRIVHADFLGRAQSRRPPVSLTPGWKSRAMDGGG
jgi:hypothetical protein